jgi:hypothetical protein
MNAMRLGGGAPARIVLLASRRIRAQDGEVVGWVGTLADITAAT